MGQALETLDPPIMQLDLFFYFLFHPPCLVSAVRPHASHFVTHDFTKRLRVYHHAVGLHLGFELSAYVTFAY